jgi:hypothetical protein
MLLRLLLILSVTGPSVPLCWSSNQKTRTAIAPSPWNSIEGVFCAIFWSTIKNRRTELDYADQRRMMALWMSFEEGESSVFLPWWGIGRNCLPARKFEPLLRLAAKAAHIAPGKWLEIWAITYTDPPDRKSLI